VDGHRCRRDATSACCWSATSKASTANAGWNGAAPTPHQVQWLADNGSPYTAAETVEFATALNLVACFTPVRSPESNGVCEAFVKTFKRDYAAVNPRPDAFSVLQRLGDWFEDYNTIHPHSGLRFRSPREFIQQQSVHQAACPV